MRLLHYSLLLGLMLGMAANASAITILGTGSGALIGGDLTDPDNNGDPENNVGYNATFNASQENGFGGGEFAFNVFDNQVGGDNAKWCCGDENGFPANPIFIDATFTGAYYLTHFTATSGNDSPGRDPIDWKIQGSNDGTTYFDIYSHTDSDVWTDRNQVLRFNAGTDFTAPATAYKTVRFITTKTTDSGNPFQLNELEYFGNPVPEPASLVLFALGAVGLCVASRRHRA